MAGETWRARLAAALAERARTDPSTSMRSVSMKAGLSEAYVSELLRTDKEPTLASLRKVCDALGVSFTHIAVGIELSQDQERLVQIYASLSDEDKALFLQLARRLFGSSEREEDKPPLPKYWLW